MLDAFVLILLVVTLGLVTWFFMRNPSLTEELTQDVEDVTESIDVVVDDIVATPKAKLPTTKVLEGLTKVKLESTARDYGVELDMRMTKANMIKDLRAQYKKL